jgi:hypothetical protein
MPIRSTMKYIAPKGVQAKPRIDKTLKIRAATGPETLMAEHNQKYMPNGRVTLRGAARLWGDVIKTAGKRMMGMDTYKKGGKVKKTGLALVHKGERVLTKKQQAKLKKRLKKSKKSK